VQMILALGKIISTEHAEFGEDPISAALNGKLLMFEIHTSSGRTGQERNPCQDFSHFDYIQPLY
jgi:hypothetical protein